MQQVDQQVASRRGQHNAGRPWGRPFQPGQSGNPHGKSRAWREARIAEVMAEIAAEFGGEAALSAGDRALLRIAAEEVIATPRAHDHEARTRSANIIARALNAIRRHRGPEPQPREPLTDLEVIAGLR
jgi:hypothetical protein